MTKDLHDKPFDEGTITKLEIFEDYAEAWIPTFVMQSHISTVCIFDFFAGTGYDKKGIAGSPIRILQKIKKHIGNIFQKKVKIVVYLNEFDPKKFELLRKACSDYLDENQDLNRAIEIKYNNEDFKDLFPKLIIEINRHPSLVYLDQNGIKFLADKYLLALEKTKQTDFLYFVSSSYIWRFGNEPEFKKYLVSIDLDTAKKDPYKFIHRNIIEQFRRKLPSHTKLKLYPFSLKKGTNIHGIIFGASHLRAVDKFLTLAWKRNETNGEANFDIDNDDMKKCQFDMFDMFDKRLTKIEAFKEEVRKKILAKEITNNSELFDYALEKGHIGNHAADCLKEMKKSGEIDFDGKSPLVTYDNVFRNKKLIEYKVSENEKK